jgi:molybdate transport system substrate-binding protein
LAEEKLVVPDTIADVGRVETALAVRSSDPQVIAKDAASLRDVLLASDAIFVPDTKASTAGIHVARILAQLGIADDIAGRLKIHPNGATAMKHLAASDAKRPIGCTQVTEIISTPGITLSGSLPPGCGLATLYAAGLTANAASPGQADILIGLLTTERALRARAGFLDVLK